jgi:hypothetical protein
MADEGTLTVEVQLDEGLPQPTGSWKRWRAIADPRAQGRTSTCRCSMASGLEIKDGVVKVGPNMMTGYAGIFAGGNMGTVRHVTVGVGHGKRRRGIDAWLRQRPRASTTGGLRSAQPWYFGRIRQCGVARPCAHLDVRSRSRTRQTNALFEARRCLSCSNCFECDNCYGVCG